MQETRSTEQNRWPAFIVCIAVAIATILDLAKVNVAIAPIETTLGASSSEAQLIVAGYILAFGICLVPAGRLGDIWNRKAMFVIGLSVYVTASLACMLAPTSGVLVLSRLLQGVAAGILMPQVIGLIQNLFQGKERGSAFGIFGAAIGLGTAFGPTIGGLFIGAFGDEWGWRWIFGMNVPIGLVILPFAIWLLPGRQRHNSSNDLDLPGVFLMAGTVLLIMLPFVLTTGTSADSPARWWMLLGAVAFAVAFYLWERRYVRAGKSPVIDFTLFQHPSYRYGVIFTSLFFAIMPPMFFLMTLFNQQGLGHEAVVVGMITIPYAIISAIISAFAGRYTYRHAASMVLIGVSLFTLALVALALLSAFADGATMPILMAIVLAAAGVAPGMVMPANQMRTVKDVPLESAGVAGSFMQVGQRLGNAMGIAIGTSIYFALSNEGTETAYRSAFSWAMVFVIGVAVVAVIIAALDFAAHRRSTRAIGGRDAAGGLD
ncbi:MFS transporter [Gulosibacter sp. ACHW.36C]|uniref:MFS transporter n=1 Tax=Gulosibacter sediminis TaxID=1729695 RepID=A0ABY4N1Q6_9MICO|nr:MFS transporter [Gulosibacter sediminis]UQN15880.1 MFS transporter [Gulosibacter sediminis]